LVVVAAVTLNEVFDRTVAGDKNGHPAGDVLVAIVVVVIVSAIWISPPASRAFRRVAAS
jgi:hypothetical protein